MSRDKKESIVGRVYVGPVSYMDGDRRYEVIVEEDEGASVIVVGEGPDRGMRVGGVDVEKARLEWSQEEPPEPMAVGQVRVGRQRADVDDSPFLVVCEASRGAFGVVDLKNPIEVELWSRGQRSVIQRDGGTVSHVLRAAAPRAPQAGDRWADIRENPAVEQPGIIHVTAVEGGIARVRDISTWAEGSIDVAAFSGGKLWLVGEKLKLHEVRPGDVYRWITQHPRMRGPVEVTVAGPWKRGSSLGVDQLGWEHLPLKHDDGRPFHGRWMQHQDFQDAGRLTLLRRGEAPALPKWPKQPDVDRQIESIQNALAQVLGMNKADIRVGKAEVRGGDVKVVADTHPGSPVPKLTAAGSNDPAALRSQLKRYEAAFEALREAPQSRYGYVLAGPFKAKDSKGGDTTRVIVSIGGGDVVSLECPKELAADELASAGLGAYVRCDPQRGVVLNVEREFSHGGPLADVREYGAEKGLLVSIGGMQRYVAVSASIDRKNLEDGGRVELDGGMNVAIRWLPSSEAQFGMPAEVSVAWEAIGGQDEAKRVLRDAVEGATASPALYAAYGRTPPKGVLLYGPPGCGKTLLAKAAATSFAKLQGGRAGFLYLKGPEVLNKYVGESERTIREMFARARLHYKRTGTRAFLFIDEADAILSRRGSQRSSDVDRTIVPAFLAEMDGMEAGSPFVLLATNRQDQLDPAVVRDGRIDRKVSVRRPDRDACRSILGMYVKGRSLAVGEGALLDGAVEELFSGRHTLGELVHEDKKFSFTIDRVISGAILAGLAERAAEKAFCRDRDAKADAPSGITHEDMATAIDDMTKAELATSHEDEVIPWAIERALDVAKATQALEESKQKQQSQKN